MESMQICWITRSECQSFLLTGHRLVHPMGQTDVHMLFLDVTMDAVSPKQYNRQFWRRQRTEIGLLSMASTSISKRE